MVKTGAAARRPVQPPHRAVAALQRQLAATLTNRLSERGAEEILGALARTSSDDPAGLQAVLAEMDIRTPQDLVGFAQLMSASGAYAALTWARGLRTEAGTSYTADDVRRATWMHAHWADVEVPAEDDDGSVTGEESA